jgi:hypothetical protein
VYIALSNRLVYVPPEILPWVWPVVLVFMAFGGYRLVFGAVRTQGSLLNAQLMIRATVKIVAGIVLFYALAHRMIPIFGIDQRIRPYVFWLLMFFAPWCVITGAAKIVLLVRPWEFDWSWMKRPSRAQTPYGSAGFADEGPRLETEVMQAIQRPKRKFMAGWHLK